MVHQSRLLKEFLQEISGDVSFQYFCHAVRYQIEGVLDRIEHANERTYKACH
jgi:hypothetical protein